MGRLGCNASRSAFKRMDCALQAGSVTMLVRCVNFRHQTATLSLRKLDDFAESFVVARKLAEQFLFVEDHFLGGCRGGGLGLTFKNHGIRARVLAGNQPGNLLPEQLRPDRFGDIAVHARRLQESGSRSPCSAWAVTPIMGTWAPVTASA